MSVLLSLLGAIGLTSTVVAPIVNTTIQNDNESRIGNIREDRDLVEFNIESDSTVSLTSFDKKDGSIKNNISINQNDYTKAYEFNNNFYFFKSAININDAGLIEEVSQIDVYNKNGQFQKVISISDLLSPNTLMNIVLSVNFINDNIYLSLFSSSPENIAQLSVLEINTSDFSANILSEYSLSENSSFYGLNKENGYLYNNQLFFVNLEESGNNHIIKFNFEDKKWSDIEIDSASIYYSKIFWNLNNLYINYYDSDDEKTYLVKIDLNSFSSEKVMVSSDELIALTNFALFDGHLYLYCLSPNNNGTLDTILFKVEPNTLEYSYNTVNFSLNDQIQNFEEFNLYIFENGIANLYLNNISSFKSEKYVLKDLINIETQETYNSKNLQYNDLV